VSLFNLELLMADVSELFMAPVLLSILILFIFALFALGGFITQIIIRRRFSKTYRQDLAAKNLKASPGFDLHNYFVKQPNASEDELEVVALKKLETLRVVTRIAPMLGLIATMIPMGPALQGLADGNIQSISENLIVAFAAVIWALAVSAITFWPASVKKRWYAEEMIEIRKLSASQTTQKAQAEPELQGAA